MVQGTLPSFCALKAVARGKQIVDNRISSWKKYFEDANDLKHCSQGKWILDYRNFFRVVNHGRNTFWMQVT